MSFFNSPETAIRAIRNTIRITNPKNSYPAVRSYPPDNRIAHQLRLFSFLGQLSELSADNSVEQVVKRAWNMGYPAVRLSAPYGGVPTPDSWDTPRGIPMFLDRGISFVMDKKKVIK